MGNCVGAGQPIVVLVNKQRHYLFNCGKGSQKVLFTTLSRVIYNSQEPLLNHKNQFLDISISYPYSLKGV